MKKKLLITILISLLCFGLFLTVSCTNENDKLTSYEIDTTNFVGVVGLGEKPDLSGISLIKKENDTEEKLEVTPDMVQDYGDTSKVGETNLIITHRGRRFTIPYTVKYRVTFVSDGTEVASQLVLGAQEVSFPEVTKENFTFVGWDKELPEALSGNVTFVARFEENKPALATLQATYGDTLAMLTLPDGINGAWRFVDAPDTKVGNAGKNTFAVEFVSSNTGEVSASATVTVEVAKKMLTFGEIVDEFVYDGKAHYPTFTLPYDVEVLPLGDGAQTAVGTYSYGFFINDANYEGMVEGEFEIKKPSITVKVGSYTLVWGNPMPEIEYVVEGFSGDVSILGISVTIPSPEVAGDYPIVATVSNTNVDATIENGTLTVSVGTIDAGAPPVTMAEVVYGTNLFAIGFDSHPHGTWAWDVTEYDETTLVGDVGEHLFRAVFTPTSALFEKVSADVKITVTKKSVTIIITGNTFVYDGTAKAPTYRVLDGETELSGVVATSPSFTDAGSYNVTLTIDDKNYEGATSGTMTIAQATPEVDFENPGAVEYRPGLSLSDIALGAGFTWKNPTTALSSVGALEFTVIYMPTDKNYKAVEGTVTVTVNKGKASILGFEKEYTSTYDGKVYAIPNTYYATNGATVSVELVGASEMRDAGTYTLRLVLAESDLYLGATEELTVKILPRENTDTVNHNQTATYGDTLASLTIPSSDKGVWAFELPMDTSVGNAGVNTFTLKFTATSPNYLDRTVEISVTVAKKGIIVPDVPHKEYTGEHITSGLFDTENYLVKSDVGGTELGTYTVTLALRDSANFTFVGTEESEVTISYQITVAPNNWVEGKEPSVASPIFYGDEIVVTGEALHGGVLVEYKKADAPDSEYTQTKPTAVGTYIVRFTTIDEGYVVLTAERPLVIAKRVIELPTLADTDFDYDGVAHSSGLTSNEWYTVVDNGGTDSGTYTATLTLVDATNYIWSDGLAGAVRTLNYRIIPTHVEVTMNGTWSGFEYGSYVAPGEILANTDAAHTLALYYATSHDGAYLPYDDSVGASLDAGSYWLCAKVEGNVNLEGSLYVSFTVTPVSLTFTDFTVTGGPYYQSDMPSLIGLGLVTFKGAEVSGTFTIGTVNFVAGGTSTAEVTFVPTSTNFVRTPLVATMSISLKSVATVGFGGTQYGTIENALNAVATSGGKVYVLPDVSGSVIIRENAEVASNVTLILPWGSGESDYNIASSGNFVATYNGTTTDYGGLDMLSRTLLVKVADGVTLTVNGTLTIAGELSGGGGGSAYAGHTAVKYAELELGSGANLVVNGTLHAFGKVTESATNNGSRTTVTSGAKLYQPFVLRDFLGGSRMYYIYSKGKNASTVYKRFIFMNVHSTVEYQYGASLIASANLYAGSQHNPTTATIIGNTTSSVIQMTSGSYIIAKYDPTSEVCDLDMYGGATLNSMSLKINTGIPIFGNVTVNSSNYLFPLSYHYQIKLNTLPGATSATYKMSQNFQMLPGASLTVNKGVDLTIGKIIILDETYADANDGTNPYPTKNPTLGDAAPLFEGAKFTVHGTLTATALGGKVYADSLSCIKAITTNSFSSKDLQTAGTGGFTGSFQATRTLTAKIVIDGVEYDWPVS